MAKAFVGWACLVTVPSLLLQIGAAYGRWCTRFRFRFSAYSSDVNPKKVDDGRSFLTTRREKEGLTISAVGGRRPGGGGGMGHRGGYS